MRPQDYGLTLTPTRTYAYVYPLPKESLMQLAYSFEDMGRPEHVHRSLQVQPGQQRLQAVVQQWHHIWHFSTPVLRVYDEGEQLRIVDTRPCALKPYWTVGDLAMLVYRLCDSAQTLTSLMQNLSAQRGVPISSREIESAIETLCHARVLLRLNGKLLSLGVAGDHPDLPTGSPSGSAGVHNLF